MFIGYSKISISVIIKHVQHIRITRAFYLPVDFLKVFSAWGNRKKLSFVVY